MGPSSETLYNSNRSRPPCEMAQLRRFQTFPPRMPIDNVIAAILCTAERVPFVVGVGVDVTTGLTAFTCQIRPFRRLLTPAVLL
jgi:hypothetical protein